MKTIREILKKKNGIVEFEAFLDTVRDKKWVMFVILRDATGEIQLTVDKGIEEEVKFVDQINSITKDSVVKIKAIAKENPAVKLNGVELSPIKITVVSEASPLPLDYNNTEGISLDTRLDFRFLDLRNKKNMLIFQIESELVKFMREYLYKHNFTEIHTPKLIGAASESGSEVFEVKYFGRKAYLAQSPQFYKQMAIASGFDRVFEVAPCFRAENSNTSRHATEFTSFDVEFAHIKSFKDVCKLESEMIKYAFEHLSKEYGETIKEVFGQDLVVPKMPFPMMALKDIYKELEERYNYTVDDSEKTDLTTEAERLVGRLSMDKFGSEFMFVTDYPADKRAFYHMRNSKGVLQGFDLIWRGVEITSGAQREHRYKNLCKVAKEKGLGKDVAFYLEFFKYGCPPHGGFAIGVDRLIMLMLNIPSVKESQLLFRGPNRLEP